MNVSEWFFGAVERAISAECKGRSKTERQPSFCSEMNDTIQALVMSKINTSMSCFCPDSPMKNYLLQNDMI